MEVYVKTLMEASHVLAQYHVLGSAMHVAVVHVVRVVLVSVMIPILLHVCAHLVSLDKCVKLLEVSATNSDMCLLTVSLIGLCINSPCQNSGFCRNIGDGTQYDCVCAIGYTGTNCETEIDNCASNPCLHSGYCTSNPTGYTCECLQGFTGE